MHAGEGTAGAEPDRSELAQLGWGLGRETREGSAGRCGVPRWCMGPLPSPPVSLRTVRNAHWPPMTSCAFPLAGVSVTCGPRPPVGDRGSEESRARCPGSLRRFSDVKLRRRTKCRTTVSTAAKRAVSRAAAPRRTAAPRTRSPSPDPSTALRYAPRRAPAKPSALYARSVKCVVNSLLSCIRQPPATERPKSRDPDTEGCLHNFPSEYTQGRCGLLPRKSLASLGEKLTDEMGSNRVVLAPAIMPMQTHAPSGSSSHSIPAMELSSSIKMEPASVDAAMTHCHSENWAESYQDLSSWCSATSASSPVTCLSPVIDEGAVGDIEFLGEIDFDLRKSEEIASVPLGEDNSFTLWGAESESSTSPIPLVQADAGVGKSDCVLLKDCWWSEVEEPKAVKELEANRPQVSIKNLLTPVTVKEEVIDAKENMNPLVGNQPFLTDPSKMEELQRRCERLASLTQPGVDSSAKAADMMRIFQGQILALNRKRHRSPAAVSDLHNYSKLHLPSTSTSTAQTQSAQIASVPRMTDIFQSDPFEGFFSATDSQSHQVQAGNQFEIPTVTGPSNQPFPQIVVCENYQPAQGVIVPGITRGSDLFIEAHQEIMRHAPKTSRVPNQQQFAASQHGFLSANQPEHAPSTTHSHPLAPAKGSLTIQLPPPRLPELDLDSLLFGSPAVVAGLGANKVQALSTPEVIKNLVETPDADSFDLLSYLCDDKPTPPVSLDNNPFHFPQLPQPSISASVTELKPNVMVVKPLSPQWAKENNPETDVRRNETSPVVVEVKPQIMPKALSDVEEEDENQLGNTKGEKHGTGTGKNLTELKETLASSRPSRSSRKRKYSEEEFELAPSISEEKPKASRGRRRNSSKYDSDEEFLPVKKSRKKSATIIEDEEEEEQKVNRPRAAHTVQRGERSVSTSSESDRYRELRDRNNEASRKSRLSRKAREQELSQQAEALTKDNRVLKVKMEEMEHLVKRLREALLHSMMNKKS